MCIVRIIRSGRHRCATLFFEREFLLVPPATAISRTKEMALRVAALPKLDVELVHGCAHRAGKFLPMSPLHRHIAIGRDERLHLLGRQFSSLAVQYGGDEA